MTKKNVLRWILVATFAATTTAACGSDDASEPSEDTAAESDSGESSGNPDVAAYCEDAEELAAELEEVLADPANADTADVMARATDLSNSAQELISANAEDADEISECSQVLAEAMNPAG